MFGFEKLEVWEKSIELVNKVYTLTRSFPSDERFGLTSQLRRAAASIPTNIAEGSGRTFPMDNCRFVETAYGSVMEVVSLSRVAHDQNMLSLADYEAIREESATIARMLSGLRASLVKKELRNEKTSSRQT